MLPQQLLVDSSSGGNDIASHRDVGKREQEGGGQLHA